jgi:pyruvate decarboxylase
MVQKKIEGARLDTPLDLNFAPNNEEKEDYVVDVVLKYLHAAKNPIILVDACAIRHRVRSIAFHLPQSFQLTPPGLERDPRPHRRF